MERLTYYNGYYEEYEIRPELDTKNLNDNLLKGLDLGNSIVQQLGRFEQLCEEYGIKNFDELVKIVRKAKGE